MKKIALVVSLLAVAAMTLSVVAAESLKAPMNKQCPVKKSDLKADCPTVECTTKAKKSVTIGVCCMDCLGKFKKECTKYPVPECKADPVVECAK